MTTKTDLLKVDFVMISKEASPTGMAFVMAIENGVPSPVPVIVENAVNPQYYNLLSASRIMFGALDEQAKWLQTLLDLCDALGVTSDDQMHKTFVSMQNSVMLAQQCATEGLDKVALTISKTGLN